MFQFNGGNLSYNNKGFILQNKSNFTKEKFCRIGSRFAVQRLKVCCNSIWFKGILQTYQRQIKVYIWSNNLEGNSYSSKIDQTETLNILRKKCYTSGCSSNYFLQL